MKNPSVCPYCGNGMLPTAYRCSVCGWRPESPSREFIAPALSLGLSVCGLMVTVSLAGSIYAVPRGDELGYGQMAVVQSVILLGVTVWLVAAMWAKSKASTAAKLTGVRASLGFCVAAIATVLALARLGQPDVPGFMLGLGAAGLIASSCRALRPR